MNIGLHPLKGPGDWAALSSEEMEMVNQVISSAEREQKQPGEEQAIEESW
jgi:hypothetical protein